MMLGCMSPNVAHLYGPAVRCKLNLQNGNGWSCASVYGPCVEQIAPGHHGYPRAFDLIQRSALEGQLGTPDHERDGETVFHGQPVVQHRSFVHGAGWRLADQLHKQGLSRMRYGRS